MDGFIITIGCLLATVCAFVFIWCLCRAADMGDRQLHRLEDQTDTQNDNQVRKDQDDTMDTQNHDTNGIIASEARDMYGAQTAGHLNTLPAYTGAELAQAYKDGATRTPSAVEVNAAARYLYNLTHDEPWDKAAESLHGEYRAQVRKVVTIMRHTATGN